MGILNDVKKYSDHVGHIKYSNERGPAGPLGPLVEMGLASDCQLIEIMISTTRN